ncbi:MAG: hypothetical protein JW829_18035 [Pirellulales bacterium]|nr:hypothetical protein [Pirellulales bacterium]
MKQITIIAQTTKGLIASISEKLGQAGINIESIAAMVVQDRDVVTLTVDTYDKALLVLRDAGYNAFSEDAEIINIKDEPGALAKITRRLYEGGINVRSIRLLYRQYGEALVAVAMDSPELGMELIQDLLVNRSK